ncbi:MAG: hypothetical protein ACFFAN_19465, partial [Promethearchaeota archaeon]
GNIKLGHGNFDLPPILIGTLFYQGESFIDRKHSEIFNEEKAKKRILTQKSLAETYRLPDLIEISGTTPKAMIRYLEFYLDHFEPPFVLGGTFEARTAGIEYLEERGIKPYEYIYNTISNLKNEKEIEILQKYKIKSAVILILGSENMTSKERYAYITNENPPNNINLIEGLKKIGINRIWIDSGVITLESLAHVLETQKLISLSLDLPVGTAPNLFLFKISSPHLNIKYHTRYRRASIMFIVSWFSNFIFYGAIEDAKECFVSTYQALEFKKVIKTKKIKILDHL